MRTSLLFLALGLSVTAQQPASAPSNPDWTRPFPPFRIIGNIYWVGTYDLSTYLITTPQGHILINTGVGDTAQQIRANVEALGFKLADVRDPHRDARPFRSRGGHGRPETDDRRQARHIGSRIASCSNQVERLIFDLATHWRLVSSR